MGNFYTEQLLRRRQFNTEGFQNGQFVEHRYSQNAIVGGPLFGGTEKVVHFQPIVHVKPWEYSEKKSNIPQGSFKGHYYNKNADSEKRHKCIDNFNNGCKVVNKAHQGTRGNQY